MVGLRTQLQSKGKDAGKESGLRQIEASSTVTASPEAAPARQNRTWLIAFAAIAGAFWVGASVAYLWGYLGVEGILQLEPQPLALGVAAIVLPPFLFVASAFMLAHALALGDTARELALISDRLTRADESAAKTAQRLGRAVRRELDALSAGLDGAFGRFRALEHAFTDRITQLEEVSARAGVKAEHIAQRLHSERQGIEELSARLDEASLRAAELLAGKSAALKAMIEAAGGELKAAGQTLDTQSAHFREAAMTAANAPQAAAIELDRQAKIIEAVSEAAASRAEFVLARQERQRVGMGELLTRLNEDANTFQSAMEQQHGTVEKAAATLAGEASRLNDLAQDGVVRLEAAMAESAARSREIAAGFGRDAGQVKESVETATSGISQLRDSLREAGTDAQTLIADGTAEAKRRSLELVNDAMAQCDQLLRAANAVAAEADKAREALSRAAELAEGHIINLPVVATKEAQRVRETVRNETDQILELSARAIATLQNRNRQKSGDAGSSQTDAPSGEENIRGGLRGLARRLTSPKRRGSDRPPERVGGSYDLSAVLAAADAGATKPVSKPGGGTSLAGQQAILAELAGELGELGGISADSALWRRFLDGDRGVFVRTLAASIGPESINRVTALYRDNSAFHESADTYLSEFENLLARAGDGDRDGFFASTLLTSDTGKLYLAIAYALGRLG